MLKYKSFAQTWAHCIRPKIIRIHSTSNKIKVSKSCFQYLHRGHAEWHYKRRTSPLPYGHRHSVACRRHSSTLRVSSGWRWTIVDHNVDCRQHSLFRIIHRAHCRLLSPVSTTRVNGPSWRVTRFHYPSTRAVLTGFPLAELTGRQHGPSTKEVYAYSVYLRWRPKI